MWREITTDFLSWKIKIPFLMRVVVGLGIMGIGPSTLCTSDKHFPTELNHQPCFWIENPRFPMTDQILRKVCCCRSDPTRSYCRGDDSLKLMVTASPLVYGFICGHFTAKFYLRFPPLQIILSEATSGNLRQWFPYYFLISLWLWVRKWTGTAPTGLRMGTDTSSSLPSAP